MTDRPSIHEQRKKTAQRQLTQVVVVLDYEDSVALGGAAIKLNMSEADLAEIYILQGLKRSFGYNMV